MKSKSRAVDPKAADSARRRFLAKAGKFAVATPPAVTMLLASAERNYAAAQSGNGVGGGGHGHGHGRGNDHGNRGGNGGNHGRGPGHHGGNGNRGGNGRGRH